MPLAYVSDIALIFFSTEILLFFSVADPGQCLERSQLAEGPSSAPKWAMGNLHPTERH